MGSCLYDLFIYPLEILIEVIFTYANRLVTDPGLAIVAVSLVVNFLVLPLYNRSDAMQAAEREKQKSMDRWVKHIKKHFTGDERFLILSTYYRQQDYKPVYVVREAFSLLLQIPFFMAAYHFLSNLGSLQGASFLFIRDLSQPDALLSVGGLSINLLPLLMTLFNVLSGAVYSRGLGVREKIQLYGMAAVFLVLLYDRPAGMAFYWMLNNLFSLLKNIFQKLIRHPKPVLKALAAGVGVAFVIIMILSGGVSRLSRVILVSVVGTGLQLPWLLPLAGRLIAKKRGRAPRLTLPEPDDALFRGLGLFLTLFLGLVIASSIINSCPEDFSTVSTPAALLLHNLCIAAGFFLVWGSIFYSLCGRSGRFVFLVLYAGFAPAALANFLLLGRDMGNLSALLVYVNSPRYDGRTILLNLAVNAVLVLLCLFLLVKKKAVVKAVCRILVLTAVGLGAMNLVTIHRQMEETRANQQVNAAAQEEKSEKDLSGIITLNREGKNVVVLMLDRGISGYIPYMLAEKPALAEQLAGFTFYPNTMTYASHTNLAAPALFGGYEYTPDRVNARTEETLAGKYNESMSVLPVLFSEHGHDVSLVDLPYIGFTYTSNYKKVFGSYKNITGTTVAGTLESEFDSQNKLLYAQKQKRSLFCYSLFRSAPALLQPTLYDAGRYYSGLLEVDADFLRSYTVLDSLPEMTAVTDGGEGTLTLMDNDATHYPTALSYPDYEPVLNPGYGSNVHTDAAGNTLKLTSQMQTTSYQVNMASLLKLGEWMDYLREQGVYDNTRIIIVSDHGYKYLYQFERFAVGDTTVWPEAYTSLLLVKDFGAGEPLKTDSRFMTVADVPTLVTDSVIENPVNPFSGEPISSAAKAEPQALTDATCFYLSDTDDGNTWRLGDCTWFDINGSVLEESAWSISALNAAKE